MSFNFMAAVTIYSDFGAPKIKSVIVSIVSLSICHEVMGPESMIFVFLMLNFKPPFSTLLFHFQEALQFLFGFYHKGGVICTSEVIDISAGNLDSSLCFFQPVFLMMYSA